MKRMFYAILILAVTGYAASAQFNGCLPGFCPSSFGGGGMVTPAATGKVLLANGSSFLLETNGTSKVCLAGGC